MPKQFIPLLDGMSTFQATARRVADADMFDVPIVIANASSRFIVAEQLAAAGVEAEILLEPSSRDSAAAVAIAALRCSNHGSNSLVLTLAADHVIADPAAFVDAVGAAAKGAREGFIMTLGLEARFPSASYGYISPGAPIGEEGDAMFRVGRFVEKPDVQTAERYMAEGYLWNSGCFLFRADVMLAEMDAYAPDVLAAARDALAAAQTDLDFVRLDAEAFARAPKSSIDYAIMERTQRAGVLAAAFEWSDIGTWSSLWEASPHDASGNAVRGNVELMEVGDSLVHSDGLLTAVVGLNDVAVVATPDAVLVTSRAQSRLVSDLVASMRASRRAEADEHVRTYRPWGWYQRIDLGTRFQVKRIMVKPGARLSLQKHHHRAEHWVVVRGAAEATVDDDVRLISENEAVYVPIGSVHRLANPGKIPLELIEIQVGSYTGEDDIVRLEDAYGRLSQ